MDIINYFLETDNTNICRICLGNAKHAKYLFSEEEESKNILNKIYICFQLSLNYEKYFPIVICEICIEELNVAYSFRQKCITFEKRFSLFYRKVTEKCNLNNQKVETEDIKDLTIIESPILLPDKYKDAQIKSSDTKIEHNEINITIQEKRLHICSICNKTLKTSTSLLKHKYSMHQKRKHLGKVTGFGVDRRYHCPKCLYSTPHSQTLVNHMRRHNGDRPYHCECGKSFTQSSSLTAHRKTHTNIADYTCAICGKQFKHAFSLKKHLDVHQTGKYSCDICHKELKSRQSLQDHMYRHYNIRNYNCEDCGDTFVTCSELLNHKKRHSSIKKVECHLCGYKTHTKKNLIIHLKRHAGDKSYKCDNCHMCFFTNGDLQRHKRVHTRDKPFPCPSCAQRFTHSTSLNKHMKAVHGIDCKWADIKSKQTQKKNLTVENS
ncbi:zinc finger protein 660-like [Vanessa tameamea]|uniref:Zinc finger protein 660-like n=1 Tax=Vanessa tameamea TaxID=334116 RepID=A0A8B8HJZ3_VANTA